MFHTYMYIYICFREHSQELDFSICKLDSKNDLQNVMICMYIYIYRFGGSWIDFERPVLSVIFQRAFNFGPLWQTFRKFNTVPPFVLRTVKPCLLRCAVMHALIFFLQLLCAMGLPYIAVNTGVEVYLSIILIAIYPSKLKQVKAYVFIVLLGLCIF